MGCGLLISSVYLVVAILGTQRSVTVLADDKELMIGSLLPFTGVWPGGNAMLASAKLALDTVNADPTILPGYYLNLTHRDSVVRHTFHCLFLLIFCSKRHDLLTTQESTICLLSCYC